MFLPYFELEVDLENLKQYHLIILLSIFLESSLVFPEDVSHLVGWVVKRCVNISRQTGPVLRGPRVPRVHASRREFHLPVLIATEHVKAAIGGL